jgi:peptidoglycan/LPS O-acetylase OafA/YrhL
MNVIDTKPHVRLHSLDSLRGIAALSVVFFHLMLVPRPMPIVGSALVSKALQFGSTGVFLFFVISGFSLSLTMPRHDRFPTPWLSYGISRFFRIAPCFFFMIVVSTIRDHISFGGGPSIPNIILNASFLFNLFPKHQEGIVWASWTIGVETLFYLTFIPMYRLGPKFQVGIAATAFCLFTAMGFVAPVSYMSWTFLGFFPLFLMGMLTFEIYARLRSSPQAVQIGAFMIFVGLSILIFCGIFIEGGNVNFRIPIGFGYSSVLLGAILHNPRILQLRTLLFYGRISYSLYLLHAPVEYACSGLFLSISNVFPVYLNFPICAIVTLAIATTAAFLVYEFIEKPGIKLGERLLQRHRSGLNPIVVSRPLNTTTSGPGQNRS